MGKALLPKSVLDQYHMLSQGLNLKKGFITKTTEYVQTRFINLNICQKN